MFQFDPAMLERVIRLHNIAVRPGEVATATQVAEQLGLLQPVISKVLEHAPWSISKSEVIGKCSLQYAFKYGNGGIQKTAELIPYQAATIGVVVHKTLELSLSDSFDLSNPKIPPETRVKTSMAMALDTYPYEEKKPVAPLTHDEIEQVQGYFDQIVAYVKKIDDRKTRFNVYQTLQERRWGITPDFKSSEFFDPWPKEVAPGEPKPPVNHKVFFRGVVDYAMLLRSHHAVIIDHKSGKVKPLDKTAAQTRAYCVMALANHPELLGVQTAINYIMFNEEPWNPHVTAAIIRDTYHPWLINFVLTNGRNLLHSEPRPQKGWWCSWCGYRPVCPKFKGMAQAHASED